MSALCQTSERHDDEVNHTKNYQNEDKSDAFNKIGCLIPKPFEIFRPRLCLREADIPVFEDRKVVKRDNFD